MEGYCLLFSEEVGSGLHVVSYCISRRDPSATVLNIKKHPSAKTSCCCNDLAQLVATMLGPLSLGSKTLQYQPGNKFLPLVVWENTVPDTDEHSIIHYVNVELTQAPPN